jgi:hypothetical protein
MRDAMIGEANARTAHAFWGTWRINAEKNLPPFPHLHAQESSHMKEVGSESRPRPFYRAPRIRALGKFAKARAV